jgi:DUF4097 and DUF4098 domain-containing protein YvlB
MRLRIPVVPAILFLALPLVAAPPLKFVDRPIYHEYPLDLAGSVTIENPTGSVEVVGVDGTTASVTAIRTTIAVDRDSMAVARNNTVLRFEPDPHMLGVHTFVAPDRTDKWSSSVKYVLKVPRTVHVRIVTRMADPIHVANIMGNVTVKSFAGNIILDNVTGATTIDTVNGKVTVNYASKPMSHARITAVSADIDVRLPVDSNFDWVADTLRGDFLTDLPVRGRWTGTTFRGSVNEPGGPTLTTVTMLGRVVILAGGNLAVARSMRTAPVVPMASGATTQRAAYSASIRIPLFDGNYSIISPFADIHLGQVRGSARVQTGGGAIEIGSVYGECIATSLGGPLDLGEIMGTLNAHTGAGDVLVRAARVGGTISTDGGIVRLLYTGGATTLRSGGGDIVVRQAAGPIDAETRSGDITIDADPIQRTQRMSAHTLRGNVIVNLPARFGADIDATILTTDPDAEVLHSDFNGLQIRKEQVGGKTRVHATGKINGGGERLELTTDDGTIHITSQATNPITVTR